MEVQQFLFNRAAAQIVHAIEHTDRADKSVYVWISLYSEKRSQAQTQDHSFYYKSRKKKVTVIKPHPHPPPLLES